MPLTAAWLLLLPLLLLSAAANPDPATEISADAAGSDLQAVLNMHNTFRSWHGAAPMTWDPELAQSAATFLTQCQFRMESGLTVGQNLGVTGAKDIGGQVEAVTQMWWVGWGAGGGGGGLLRGVESRELVHWIASALML